MATLISKSSIDAAIKKLSESSKPLCLFITKDMELKTTWLECKSSQEMVRKNPANFVGTYHLIMPSDVNRIIEDIRETEKKMVKK